MRIDDWRMEQAWAEPEDVQVAEAPPPAPPAPAPAPATPPEPPPLPFWAEGTPVPQSLLERLPAAQLQAPPEATASIAAAPTTAPAAAPAAPAPSGYVGEPPADAAWLAQREAAFGAVRSDYEAARSLAQSQPQIGGAPAPGWVATQPSTDESGQLPQQQAGSLVFIPSADTTPVITGYDESGPIYSQPAGQWLAFDEAAFAQSYQAQGGAPLQSLARLYDSTPAALLGAHPELWSIATTDHALNAGPPPAGRAMGDATQLGMVDLYMADPQVAKLIDAFGGSASPATGGIAKEQARLYGEARYEQLSRLGNAMQSVRDQYSGAMANAAAGGSTAGWVEREVTTTTYDESGGQQTTSLQRSFDPDAFTAWYTAQDGLANQAFRDFYGQSHTTSNGTDESGQSLGSTITFDNPNWTMSGIGGGMAHKELVRIDPNAPPRLNNDGAVGFDLEAGWATHQSNIHQKKDWFETVVQVAAVAVVSYFTAGAASGWAAAAGWGSTAAAVAGGVAAGAASAAVSGAMNGNLAFKDILRGALAGGLSGGLLAEFGGVAASYGPIGTVALRTTVQGGIQALLGGSFKDGAIAGFASGLADVTGASLKANIDKAVAMGTMSAAQATAANTFSRVLGSAIRAAGNPSDPASAAAGAFLSDVLAEADPAGFKPPAVATATQGSGPYSAHDYQNGADIADGTPTRQADANTIIDDRMYAGSPDADAFYNSLVDALGSPNAGNDADPALLAAADGYGGLGRDAATGGPAVPDAAARAAAVFSTENLVKLPTLQVAGAGNAQLAEAMAALQGVRDSSGNWSPGGTPEQIEQHLKTVAAQRGVPLEKIQSDYYDKFLNLAAARDSAAKEVRGYQPQPQGTYSEGRSGDTLTPLLSMSAANGLPNNSVHMGSVNQLRFGQLVGDVLGIDPVFGALLSPTGGIPGAGNQQVGSALMTLGGGPDVVVPHGIAHDAGGYLLNYHQVGPGYQYAPTDSLHLMDRNNPKAGQVGGIDFFWNLKQFGTPTPPEQGAP